jgi:HSP20 family protein
MEVKMPTGIARWRPFEPLVLPEQFGATVFEDFSRLTTWQPDVDVYRKNGTLVVKADLPGFKPEDVKIEVEGNLLTVTGTREETIEEKKESYVCHERRYGTFERIMTLPEGAQPNNAKANFHDGVLELDIPVKIKTTEKFEIKPSNN